MFIYYFRRWSNLLASHEDINQLQNIVNTELNELDIWFKANKLSLNVKKTNFINFSQTRKKTRNQNIMIDKQSLSQVQITKFLGVTVDEKLTWNQHINNTRTKSARTIGVINKLKHFLPQSSLLTLYNALVLPNLS